MQYCSTTPWQHQAPTSTETDGDQKTIKTTETDGTNYYYYYFLPRIVATQVKVPEEFEMREIIRSSAIVQNGI